jgi:hypothetical protein
MTPHRRAPIVTALALLAVAIVAPVADAQIAVSANDNKVSVLSIEGTRVEYTKRNMTPGLRPIVMDVAATGAFAVVGHLAGGPTGDSDAVTLMDLTAKPPRVVDTVGVLGSTAEGLKISPDASVVAVVVHNGSNRPKESPFFNDAGKLVIVRVTGKTLARVAEAPIGHWSQGVAWSPDGKTLLVGNMVEKDYWVFTWDGSTLKDTGHRVKVNGGPAGIRTAER